MRPLYSAKYLLADVPKKLVTKVVIIREKLKMIFIDPRISFPKVRAIKKLNKKGENPMKVKAKPV